MYALSKLNLRDFETPEYKELCAKIESLRKLFDKYIDERNEIGHMKFKYANEDQKKNLFDFLKCIPTEAECYQQLYDEKQALVTDVFNKLKKLESESDVIYESIKQARMNASKEPPQFESEDAAYEYFYKMQGYNGPRILDWRRIREYIYAPTSKVHLVKDYDTDLDDYIDKNRADIKQGDVFAQTKDNFLLYVYIFDGYDAVGLGTEDRFDEDYDWTMDLPRTYFSVNSIYLCDSIYKSSLISNTKTPEEFRLWIEAINKMNEEKADYCIINEKYVVVNTEYDEEIHDPDTDSKYLYLKQDRYFRKIPREKMPANSIIHRDKLVASDWIRMISKETGIPIHNIFSNFRMKY